MSERPVRVRMLVGVYREDAENHPDQVQPIVAGCIDETIWEVVPPEEDDKRHREWREAFDPRDGDYDWREIVVELDTATLRKLLVVPTVAGEAKAA